MKQSIAELSGKHTPTPWHILGVNKQKQIQIRALPLRGGDNQELDIALIPAPSGNNEGLDKRNDNASFMVKAVNEYEGLQAKVAAMKSALEAADKWVKMYHGKEGHDAAARAMTDVIEKVLYLPVE